MILPPEHGMVCLTFDDGRYTEWLAQLSLFAEYDAHATFFYNGIPDKAALDSMKQLRSAGHAVGIHTVHHKDADGMTAEEYLRTFLPIPEGRRVLCAVAIGHSSEAERPRAAHPEDAERVITL